MYVCMYICTYVRMHVCMYTCPTYLPTYLLTIGGGDRYAAALRNGPIIKHHGQGLTGDEPGTGLGYL